MAQYVTVIETNSFLMVIARKIKLTKKNINSIIICECKKKILNKKNVIESNKMYGTLARNVVEKKVRKKSGKYIEKYYYNNNNKYLPHLDASTIMKIDVESAGKPC